MIVATSSTSSLLKGIINRDSLSISKIDKISKDIRIDPNTFSTKVEVFVVSSDDVKNSRLRNDFIDSLENKHPDSVVMFLNKSGRQMPNLNTDLFEAYLIKPKKEDVKNAFERIVRSIEEKNRFKVEDDITTPEEFNIEESSNFTTSLDEEDEDVVIKVEESLEEEPEELEIPEQKEYKQEVKEISLLDRIKNSENWASLQLVASEVNASRILQEIAESNSNFRQTENYIQSLSENVVAILSNPENDLNTKLKKVRAVLCEKSYLKAKTNSIVEQSVEKIITSIVDKAKEEVNRITEEYDSKLNLAFKKRMSNEAPNVRLSTLIENRSKVLLELNALDLELKGIASNCINTINDTTTNIVEGSNYKMESPILDSQIKARFGEVIPDNLLDVLDALCKTGESASSDFAIMSDKVNSTIKKLYALLSLYKEETEILAETIKYLKANKVEDTVLANNILKKTNRLYVVDGERDSIALTYIISKHQSRTNNNVMLLDLTGSYVLDLFGINSIKYSKFMESTEFDHKFLVVSNYDDKGLTIETEEDCQRLEQRLLHYAKHYSKINIMITPEQKKLLEYFRSEVISINYLVDCYPPVIKKFSTCIQENNVQNTATRVILVNYQSDSQKICSDLNILDRMDVQLVMSKPIETIRYCSLRGQDPYDVDSILEDCGGVLKEC